MINVLNCKTWKIAIACAIQRFAIICSFRKVCNDIVCNYFVVQLLGLQFIRCHLDGRPQIEVRKILKFAKLWMAIYPPRIAPFGLKLGQNAFQTIPNISCFDVEQKKITKKSDRKLSFSWFSSCFWRAMVKRTSKSDSTWNFAPDTPFLRSVRPKEHQKRMYKGLRV